MSRTEVIGGADRALADSSALTRLAGGLIIGTIVFNGVLCFLNTRGIAISDFHVMFSEVVLISAAVVVARNSINSVHLCVLGVIILYTVTLAVIRDIAGSEEGFHPKITRDLIIPVTFFLLGKAVDDAKAADKIVFAATSVVMVFALFEYFFLDTFLKVFGIAEYYISRGTLVDSDHTLNVSKGLIISGFRPEGRTLASFLGGHRVSSIFLEPVTLGNFATWVTLWAVIRSRMEGRLYVWCALGGIVLLVLSDARFDAGFLVFAVAMMLLIPARYTTLSLFLLPFIVAMGLYLLAAAAGPFDGRPLLQGVGIYDRLLYSGRVLFYLDAYNWFGLKAARANVMDAGYAYVINYAGILGYGALWLLFMSLEGANRYFYQFRNVVALYLAALLCISASQFTIKIAALLWFMVGVLSVAKVDGSRRAEPTT
jgi:putative polymerase